MSGTGLPVSKHRRDHDIDDDDDEDDNDGFGFVRGQDAGVWGPVTNSIALSDTSPTSTSPSRPKHAFFASASTSRHSLPPDILTRWPFPRDNFSTLPPKPGN